MKRSLVEATFSDVMIRSPTRLRAEALRRVLRSSLALFRERRRKRLALLKLTVFIEVADPNHLFIAFNDLTRGAETYPAGRYLDLPPNGTNIYEVDFNRAYNPYCYYNQSYECPLPPKENQLKVPIRAGERMKHTSVK